MTKTKWTTFSLSTLEELEKKYIQWWAGDRGGEPSMSFTQWLRAYHYKIRGDQKDEEQKKNELGEAAKFVLDVYSKVFKKRLGVSPLIYGAKDISFIKQVLKTTQYTKEALACLMIEYVKLDDQWLRQQLYPITMFWRNMLRCEEALRSDFKWVDTVPERFYLTHIEENVT